MLFGAVIAPGSSVTPKNDLANIVHLSQICLNEPTSNERTYVQLVDGDKAYNICTLQKGVHEHTDINLKSFPCSSTLGYNPTLPTRRVGSSIYLPVNGIATPGDRGDEKATVDVFFSTLGGLKLTTKGGKNEVHLVGYFEPEEDSFVSDSEDEDDELVDEEEEEEEEESEDEEPASKRKQKGKK